MVELGMKHDFIGMRVLDGDTNVLGSLVHAYFKRPNWPVYFPVQLDGERNHLFDRCTPFLEQFSCSDWMCGQEWLSFTVYYKNNAHLSAFSFRDIVVLDKVADELFRTGHIPKFFGVG
jgi:hypothetical protein